VPGRDPQSPGSPVGELAPFAPGLGAAIWKSSVADTYIRLPSSRPALRSTTLELIDRQTDRHEHRKHSKRSSPGLRITPRQHTYLTNSLPSSPGSLTTTAHHHQPHPKTNVHHLGLAASPPTTVKLASSTLFDSFDMMPSQRPSQLPPCPGPPPSRPLPPLPKRG